MTKDRASANSRIAAILIDQAVRLVPVAQRARYWHEFRGELRGLSPRRQRQYAAGVLGQAPRLRGAIGRHRPAEPPLTVTGLRYRPVSCRLNLRHHWMVLTNDDGEHYRRCMLCGVDNMEFGARALDGDINAGVIMGIANGGQGGSSGA